MTMLSPEAAQRDLDDAFAIDPIKRDKPWGRALLIPTPERAADPLVRWPKNRKPDPDGRLPYTRASTMGNYVADQSALEIWRRRSLTKGLGEREDLAAMAAGLPPITSNFKNKDTLTPHEREMDKATNAQLDWIAEEAEKHANRDYKANWGTAIHHFTDPDPSGDVPERMRADVEAFRRNVSRWQFLATEVFVANETYQAAGSFDHLVVIPSRLDLGAVVVDVKSGLLHPDSMAIQTAVYAGAEVYDGFTDERRPLEDLTGGIPVNQDFAIIMHIPLGMGKAQPYFVDMHSGRRGAELACQVRAYRQDADGFMWPHDFIAEERLQVADHLVAATTIEQLKAIRKEAIDNGVWVPDLEDLAVQQRALLTR